MTEVDINCLVNEFAKIKKLNGEKEDICSRWCCCYYYFVPDVIWPNDPILLLLFMLFSRLTASAFAMSLPAREKELST